MKNPFVNIKVDRAENVQYKGQGLALFQQVETFRTRLGKKFWAGVRVLDNGVRIYARAHESPAGNLVRITGGGGITLYSGVYDFITPNYKVWCSPYDLAANTIDAGTEVIAYEDTTLPGGDTVFYSNAQVRLSGESAYAVFTYPSALAGVSMYKDNTLLATRSIDQCASDAGGTSGGFIEGSPGILTNGYMAITGYYTNPAFVVYTSIYDTTGTIWNTLKTGPFANDICYCMYSDQAGNIYAAVGEAAPNDLYRTRVYIYDSDLVFQRSISLYSQIGMTGGSGATHAFFVRGTNLYVLTHGPTGSSLPVTMYFGVVDLTTDTYSNIHTRTISSGGPFISSINYDGFTPYSIYVNEAEDEAYFVWLWNRVFTVDTRRAKYTKSGAVWSYIGDVNMLSDPDKRAGIYLNAV